MNSILITCIAAAFALAAANGAEKPGMLHFLNDDSLPGKFRALDREHIIWDSPSLANPATFFTGKIRDLRLPAIIRTPENTVSHEATLTLMNGDTVRGQLASVTDSEITLDTWYAGRLVFRRVMVRDLAIREMPEYLYRGPRALDEWTQTSDPPRWSMTDAGELLAVGAGGIAKAMPFQEAFTLDFEVQWKGSFRLNMIILSDDLHKEAPDHGYEIIFQTHSIHIRRCGHQWIGNSNRAHELRQNEKARIRLRVSTDTGQFALYINDRLIEVWTDPEFNTENLGTGLHFISRDNSPIMISRLDLSTWNGIVEERVEERAVAGRMVIGGVRMGWNLEDEPEEVPEMEVENGYMMLRNGDHIRGTVRAIEDGTITIETPYREVKLPVERLRTLALAPVDLEEPKRENGDVRASFADGGSIVFRLEGVTDDGAKVQGYSQTFGNAVFDLSAFNRLEFNIYDLFREVD
jgi:hypothetical protein